MAASNNSHWNIFLSPITSDYLDVKLIFRMLKIRMFRLMGTNERQIWLIFRCHTFHLKIAKTTPFFFQIFEMVEFDRLVERSIFFTISYLWYKCQVLTHVTTTMNLINNGRILFNEVWIIYIYMYEIIVSFFISSCFK